ncbi:MAG: HAD family phosphatase [Pseudomonadota bacterium]
MSGRFAALIFDFDGVVIDSEYASNAYVAELLTAEGHPTTPEQAMDNFMGLAGQAFHSAIERWIGAPLPEGFEKAMQAQDERAIAKGIEPVAGAPEFIAKLLETQPRAVASSSSLRWIKAHLGHLGLERAFGDHIYSGREHVTRGKPAPDIYFHAARALDVPIERCAIIEDSPVGVTAAVASGAYVIGLVTGNHCASDHGEKILALGAHTLARDYEEVGNLLR